jgi:hypothetical protein
MGFKRFLMKSLIPGYTQFDMIRKIAENGVVDGIKEELKESYLEDMPIISHIYNAGKYEGKKEGYAQASFEYEKKLLEQGEEFLKQKRSFENQKAEYEELINTYEKYIDEMIQKDNLSAQEKDYLSQIMVMERKLKKLHI